MKKKQGAISENDAELKQKANDWIRAESVSFIENKGQMSDMNGDAVPYVLFKTEAPGLNFWITEKGITLQTLKMQEDEHESSHDDERVHCREETSEENKDENVTVYWERIDIELKGASINKANVVAEYPHESHNNYFYPICPEGIYGVKEYDNVTIKNVYPNIDWVFYRKEDGVLKYDFIVHPGADYKQIELLYRSKTPIKINTQGELEQFTDYGNIKENTPVSFYEEKEIKTQFVQNYQEKITIGTDFGYATSIKFSLQNFQFPTLNSQLIIDPQLTWATFFVNSSNGASAVFTSATTDNFGNLFFAGEATGSILGSTFPVQNAGTYFQGISAGFGDMAIVKFNSVHALSWSTFYGGSSFDRALSLAADIAGNLFLTGETGSANFPLQNAGTYFNGTPGVAGDAFVLKFNNSGTRLWATYLGGNNSTQGWGIAVDATTGDICVVGTTATTSGFPTLSTGTFFQATRAGIYDVFISKFSNSGTLIWSTYYGGSQNECGRSVFFDLSGNLFVAGITRSPNFPVQNAGTYFDATHNGGFEDAFIVKFDNMGNRRWATYYGGGGEDFVQSLAADPFGNIFVAGYTTSTNFPTQNAGTYYDGSFGGTGIQQDAFLLKFDNAGNRLWATFYGGPGTENISGQDVLEIDKCGNVYFCFSAQGGLDTKKAGCSTGYFIDTLCNPTRNPSHCDLFIARFSNSGILHWASYINGNGDDHRGTTAIDNSGNLFLGLASRELGAVAFGAYYTLVNPGGGAYYNTFSAVGARYILEFSPDPPPTYSKTQINPSVCGACSGIAKVSLSCGEGPYTYSWSTGASTVNTLSVIDSITGLCVGTYWVKVTSNCNQTDSISYTITGPSNPATGTDVRFVCDSLRWIDGNTYTTSTTTPTFTIVAGATSGCDSIVTLSLSIGNPINTSGIQNICNGQNILIHGINQTIAGVYTQTYTAVGGCDSVSSVTLNVNSLSTSTINPVSCTSYTLNSLVYSSSGIYTQTLTNALGCDSLLIINLNISPTINTNNNVTICSGQTTVIHGVSQNTSGVYTQTFVSAAGCDSISSITLNVNSLSTTTINPAGCTSYTLNSQVYSSSGIYTQTLTNASGCDSLLTINLTISSTINTNNSQTICSGASATIHGVNQTVGGIYTQTFATTAGCDSISTINLSVTPTPTLTVTPLIDTINLGNNITITATGASAYTWSNGSTTSSIMASPSQNTTYCVIGTNSITCADTICSDVLVISTTCDSAKLFIPTGFSPNGDGQNDELRLFANGYIESLHFAVYNRWGQIVFETNDITKTWNGYFKGQLLDADVFTYTLRYSCKNNNSKSVISGNISLIR